MEKQHQRGLDQRRVLEGKAREAARGNRVEHLGVAEFSVPGAQAAQGRRRGGAFAHRQFAGFGQASVSNRWFSQ